ncbi:hypothetical protein [Desulfuribacillus stibiiarsenatis]|uniref:hypothetical protein n=1 Tax=Desulfuribacillus stibiiarsenatis TaxID=1390249 RepID=UPI0015B73E5F|nr:hypothetical protein [Desulfuribacillus stibiiarsenatis]
MPTNKQKKNGLVPEGLGSADLVNLHVNNSTTNARGKSKRPKKILEVNHNSDGANS